MTQDEFTIEALRRLRVAASLIAVFAIICSEERMAKIFSEHRGRSYEYILSFHGVATPPKKCCVPMFPSHVPHVSF